MNIRGAAVKVPSRRGSRAARHGTIAGIAVFLLLVGSGASYAYWKATATLAAQAGSATVLLEASADPGAFQFQYGPSAPTVVVAPVTITNKGSVALPLTVSFSPRPASTVALGTVHIDIWEASDCTVLGAPLSWSGTLDALVAATGPAVGTLASPGSADFCVRTALSSADAQAQQGGILDGTLVFTGTKGWVSSGNVAISQSVYRVPTPTSLTCLGNNPNNALTLTWLSAGIGVTYQVEFTPPAVTPPFATSALTHTIDVDDFASTVNATVPGKVSVSSLYQGWKSAAAEYGVRFEAKSTGNNDKLYCVNPLP